MGFTGNRGSSRTPGSEEEAPNLLDSLTSRSRSVSPSPKFPFSLPSHTQSPLYLTRIGSSSLAREAEHKESSERARLPPSPSEETKETKEGWKDGYISGALDSHSSSVPPVHWKTFSLLFSFHNHRMHWRWTRVGGTFDMSVLR